MMDLSSESEIELALGRVGEQLAFDRQRFSVVIVGGAALNLLGFVSRATSDVDVIAFASQLEGTSGQVLSRPPDPIPPELESAIQAVATDMNLDPHWMNTGFALQWSQGLPPGLAERIAWRHFGPDEAPNFGLDVGLVSRYDLIFFKLYAAADHAHTGSVHYKDLLTLKPTASELDAAADWIRPQNASPEFHAILEQLMDHLIRDITS